MIQIDMPMPTNCLDCPACNEYLMCAIPANGRGWGENDVREYGQSRPEWCPLKEQETTTFKPHYIDKYSKHFICGLECGSYHKEISSTYHYCPYCGKAVKWK